MEIVCVLHTSFLYNCQVSFLYFTGYCINNLQLQPEERRTVELYDNSIGYKGKVVPWRDT